MIDVLVICSAARPSSAPIHSDLEIETATIALGLLVSHLFEVAFDLQITLNARRHRRRYSNTACQARIRFKPIWDRYKAGCNAFPDPRGSEAMRSPPDI